MFVSFADNLSSVHPRKTEAKTYLAEGTVIAYFGGDETGCSYCLDCYLASSVK